MTSLLHKCTCVHTRVSGDGSSLGGTSPTYENSPSLNFVLSTILPWQSTCSAAHVMHEMVDIAPVDATGDEGTASSQPGELH